MRVYSINLMRNNFLIKYKQEIDFMQNKILKEGKDKTEKKKGISFNLRVCIMIISQQYI